MVPFIEVAKTGCFIEEAMRAVDKVLTQGFHFGTIEWSHRNISHTRVRKENDEGPRSHDLRKEVKIRGKISLDRRITAEVKFKGSRFLTVSAFDEDDDVDHSEPLAIYEISFEIGLISGRTIKKTCFVNTAFDGNIESWRIR